MYVAASYLLDTSSPNNLCRYHSKNTGSVSQRVGFDFTASRMYFIRNKSVQTGKPLQETQQCYFLGFEQSSSEPEAAQSKKCIGKKYSLARGI